MSSIQRSNKTIGKGNKQTRNRRSRKHGNSWSARVKRLADKATGDNSNSDKLPPNQLASEGCELPFVNTEAYETAFHDCDTLLHIYNEQRNSNSVPQSHIDSITTLRRRLLVMTKYCILGVMSLYGTCAFTTRQYDHMCAILAIANADFVLPCASSLRKVKWPFFIANIFPKAKRVDFECTRRFQLPTVCADGDNDGNKETTDHAATSVHSETVEGCALNPIHFENDADNHDHDNKPFLNL